MQGYLWIIWVKIAGALWIIGGKLCSSLIFYFVAIDPRSTKNASRNLYSPGAQSAPASNKCLHETGTENNSDQYQVIPPAGASRLTSDRHEFRPG
jgi:hypothetical protein